MDSGIAIDRSVNLEVSNEYQALEGSLSELLELLSAVIFLDVCEKLLMDYTRFPRVVAHSCVFTDFSLGEQIDSG